LQHFGLQHFTLQHFGLQQRGSRQHFTLQQGAGQHEGAQDDSQPQLGSKALTEEANSNRPETSIAEKARTMRKSPKTKGYTSVSPRPPAPRSIGSSKRQPR
jgi:hypothetical protein